MATKKQVRRRQKERRHEWEEVYVDAEGNVIDAPPEEDEPTPAGSTSRRQPARASRSTGRTVQPPSWRRVARRGAIFAPLMFITVMLLAPDDATVAQNVAQTVFLMLIFLPFSYAMDALTYRMYLRRTGQSSGDNRA